MHRLLAASVVLFICVWAGAQTPDEYLCKFAPDAPTLDGVLDDPCWAAAEDAPALYETGVAADPAQNRSNVRLVMDKSALYLGAQMPTAPGAQPSAVERPRDGSTWNDDSLELFLARSFTSRDYCHMTFNALGSRMDANHEEDIPADEQTGWNPDWEVVTKTREGGWSAEARIPWAAFGLKSAPDQGHVWRIKLGCMAKGFLNSMWPRNETGSFHSQACWGYLIFGDRNLVSNPGFEDGVPDKDPPRGWLYAYYDAEGKGKCSVTDEAAASGKYSGRLEKFDDQQWFPVLYTRELPVQPGSTYELKAMARCDRAFTMRYNLIGGKGDKRSQQIPATDGWQPVRIEATVPEAGVERLMVGFQLISTKGVILVDDMVVRRLNDVKGTEEVLPTPHPYHNLEELASRTAIKPYDLLKQDDGSYQSDRTIFHDSGTGSEVWMLTRSAGASTRHYYMEITPWNADGTLLSFNSGQLGKGSVLMPADASSWSRMPFYASGAVWDRVLPERLYFRKYRGHTQTDLWDLAIGNVLTGETRVTKSFDGDLSLWPVSQDGKKLLAQETMVGEDGKPYSRLWVMDREGEEGLMLTPEGLVHQTWFTKLGDYSIEFEWEGQKPSGQYMISTDNVVRKICDTTYGHRAHSPNGEWIAGMGACHIRHIKTGEVRVISDQGSNHQTWETSNDWYCTSSGRYLTRVIAFGSPTVQRIGAHNSGLRHSTYWSEAHPEMSHDGTKLGFASSMLGDIEFYFMVMRRPDPPTLTRASATATGVELEWKPGQFSTETRGYLVYASQKSGEWGEQVTPEPVTGTGLTLSREVLGWKPGDITSGLLFLRVTAIDHTGLESIPSNELAWISDLPLPRTLYFEAEAATYEAPAVEVFDPTAAGLYALSLGKLRQAGPVGMLELVPQLRRCRYLWVRARSSVPAIVSAKAGELDFGNVSVQADEWTWLRASKLPGIGGDAGELTLEASAPGVIVDRICLTTEPDYEPSGLGGMDQDAPQISGLKAAPEGEYATRLSWEASDALDLSHYNVYCGTSPDFELSQERLIASPAGAEYVDWGLKPGAAYYYRVTAVDRSRNESSPTDAATATTAGIPARVFTELDAKWDTTQSKSLELPFTMPEGGQFVIWGKVQSLDGNRSAPLSISLDGRQIDQRGVSFDYICVGHGGPVLKTWLWNCFRPGRTEADQPAAYAATAGEHTLTLTAADGVETLWDGFIITNDLGFEPEGTVDFVVRPEE